MAKQKLGDRVFGWPIVERVVDACLLLIYAGWAIGTALAALFIGLAIASGFFGGRLEFLFDLWFQRIRIWADVSQFPIFLFWAAAIIISIVVVLMGGRILLNGLTEIRESL